MTVSDKTAIPAELKAHRYVELDSLRGLAAVSVVLYHFSCIWIDSPAVHALRVSPLHVLVGGHEAVVFFFLLSGFVLCVPYNGKRPPSYPVYLVQRLIRIYIPFAAAILIAVALDARFYSTVRTGNFWLDQTWSVKPTFAMVKSLLLTKSLFGTQANTAIWSILLEIRISLIFPLLYFAVKRLPAPLIVAIAVVTPPVASQLGVSSPHFYSPFFTAGLFCFGVILYLNLESMKNYFQGMDRLRRTWFIVVSVLLFELPLILVEALHLHPGDVASGLEDYVIAIGAAGIIVAAICAAPVRKALQHPFLLRNGALSYSTYLIHGTVLFCLIRYFMGKVNLIYLFPVFLILTYLAAEIFHFLIDSRAVLLGRAAAKFVRELKPAAAPQSAAIKSAE